MNRKLVLLGDSIFANAAYVPRGSEVLTQLWRLMPASIQVDLLARDGARMHDLAAQLQRMPDDATHVLISIGGNDVLQHTGLLQEPCEFRVACADAAGRARVVVRARVLREPHEGTVAAAEDDGPHDL